VFPHESAEKTTPHPRSPTRDWTWSFVRVHATFSTTLDLALQHVARSVQVRLRVCENLERGPDTHGDNVHDRDEHDSTFRAHDRHEVNLGAQVARQVVSWHPQVFAHAA